MIIITTLMTEAQEMKALHDREFKESQLKRIAAINALKLAGDKLIEIKNLFADAQVNEEGLIETDAGSYKSFKDYLRSNDLGFSMRSAYNYIKLAENWDIVNALGMQDPNNADKCMRLCRTLKIIDWYGKKIMEGWTPEELTLELYWEEQDSPNRLLNRPNYKKLYEEAQQLIAQLEAELAKFKL